MAHESADGLNQETKAQPPPLWHSLVAGSVGGICNTVIGHPLDTIKTRLQSSGSQVGLFRGLYSGVGSRMAGVIPDWIACYTGYSIGKRIQYPAWAPKYFDSIMAGCIAGFMGGLVLCPFDAVKIHAQNHHCSTIDAIRRLGPRGLMTGFSATMIWSVPSQGVFFLAYDVAADYYSASASTTSNRNDALSSSSSNIRNNSQSSSSSGSSSSSSSDEGVAMKSGLLGNSGGILGSSCYVPPALWVCAMAGGWAGVAEWLFTLPLDTVKTRVQAGESANFREGVRDVVRLFGWRGLFKGFWPVMLRAFPSSAAALGGIHLVEVAFADMERRKVLLADDVPRLARKHTSGGGKLGIDTAPDNKQSLATVIAQVDTGDRTS